MLKTDAPVADPSASSPADISPPIPVSAQWTREHALVIVLVVMTAIFCGLCLLLAWPFTSSLAWALALAIVALPLHRWSERRIPNRNAATIITVVAVAMLIVAPSSLVLHQLGREVARAGEYLSSGHAAQAAEAAFEKYPALAPAGEWIESQLDAKAALPQSVATLQKLVTRSIGAAIGLLVTFFFLFFILRDRSQALQGVRALVPLAKGEADDVFRRVSDTIHATVFGTVVVAMIQGTLGGLMFWWLGLPQPLLWGFIMGVLAIVPVLGAFVVWVPAAIYLLLIGSWGKALILTLWGAAVIGLIDNLLYPALVGKRLRMHTAPVFVSIVGGLAIFGAAGLILGPVILAVTHALIDIWRRRTRHGPAEAAVAPRQ